MSRRGFHSSWELEFWLLTWPLVQPRVFCWSWGLGYGDKEQGSWVLAGRALGGGGWVSTRGARGALGSWGSTGGAGRALGEHWGTLGSTGGAGQALGSWGALGELGEHWGTWGSTGRCWASTGGAGGALGEHWGEDVCRWRADLGF